jgi:oligopeptide/dipeptide ABC transporter ATP-binding protein
MTTEILRTEKVTKRFYQSKATVLAVDEVDFDLKEGETLGLVGESGSGKSTLGKLLIGLLKPSSGNVYLNGKSLEQYSRLEKAKLVQMVFQDWQSSLNPKMPISKILSEAWMIHRYNKKEIEQKLLKLADDFELDSDILQRTPRELSGGQLQRVTIARALSINPKILIADEPTSSLDITLRRQVLELFKNKINKMGLNLIIISHDLDAVVSLASKVLIMFRGKIVEMGSPDQILKTPIHPYTLRLIHPGQFPDPEGNWEKLNDDFSWENGCPFTGVCQNTMNICREELPIWKHYGNGHWALCHV